MAKLQQQQQQLTGPVDPWSPSFGSALRLLLVVRVGQAVLMPQISDCDEVFNYWEPAHYLQFGRGLQTWEYAPEFALRSWAYVGLHALVGNAVDSLLNNANIFLPAPTANLFPSGKLAVFYGVRAVLAGCCAVLEACMYSSVVKNISSRTGRYMLVMMLMSPGMYLASAAFLPSSFAMFTTMAAFTLWCRRCGQRPSAFSNSGNAVSFSVLTSAMREMLGAVWALAVGAVWGWPFSGAVGLPLVTEEVFARPHLLLLRPATIKQTVGDKDKTITTAATLHYRSIGWRVVALVAVSLISLLTTLGPLMWVDWMFYRQWLVVPFNIVSYNVLSGGGDDAGPDIFGTEPWSYYFVNGFLNFNVAFVAALAAAPVLLLTSRLGFEQVVSNTNVSFFALSGGHPYRSLLFKTAPMYLWLAIFTLQPHKEERFLFVIYPLICFNAAVSVTFVVGWCRWFSLWVRTVRWLPTLFAGLFCAVFSLLAISRIAALYSHYGSSIAIYEDFYHSDPREGLLCIGREWYRFPGHSFIPDGIKVGWVEENYGSHLPKYFAESEFLSPNNYWWHEWIDQRPGTWSPTTGFNNKNQQDPSNFVHPSECDYRMYLKLPSLEPDEFEPSVAEWKQEQCLPYLDSSLTDRLSRAFWWPRRRKLDSKGDSDTRVWGQYCWYIRQNQI